jgi:predicted HAD superfamily phosphohydrolase YqeG
MQPTWHAATIDALTPAFLEQQQVRGVIWDVDGTLTSHHGAQVEPALAPAFRRLVEASNVRHVIVSNAPDARFTQLAQLFPDIPILRLYALHGEVIPHRLHGSRNSLSREEFDALQAAGAVVLRKPNARLTQYALQELDCSASEALMIGDQFMTDVAGARMADVRALKVETAAPRVIPVRGTDRAAYRTGAVYRGVWHAALTRGAGLVTCVSLSRPSGDRLWRGF